jgi:predicted O-methyltransferase YrrM
LASALRAQMNPILQNILRSGRVTDERGADFPLLANMSEAEGGLIDQVIRLVKPHTSLEVGFAYGISTLFACGALDDNRKPCRHVVIDPVQSSFWKGIGWLNVRRAGYERFVELMEAPSEIALPKLLEQDTRIQSAIIDGMHTFDHALVDFFYINKMMDVGGAVILDDVNMPSIVRLASHIATYPAYEVLAATAFPEAPNLFVSARRRMSGGGFSPRHSRDNPSCVAFRKIKPDERGWDWHRDF